MPSMVNVYHVQISNPSTHSIRALLWEWSVIFHLPHKPFGHLPARARQASAGKCPKGECGKWKLTDHERGNAFTIRFGFVLGSVQLKIDKINLLLPFWFFTGELILNFDIPTKQETGNRLKLPRTFIGSIYVRFGSTIYQNDWKNTATRFHYIDFMHLNLAWQKGCLKRSHLRTSAIMLSRPDILFFEEVKQAIMTS